MILLRRTAELWTDCMARDPSLLLWSSISPDQNCDWTHCTRSRFPSGYYARKRILRLCLKVAMTDYRYMQKLSQHKKMRQDLGNPRTSVYLLMTRPLGEVPKARRTLTMQGSTKRDARWETIGSEAVLRVGALHCILAFLHEGKNQHAIRKV